MTFLFSRACIYVGMDQQLADDYWSQNSPITPMVVHGHHVQKEAKIASLDSIH